VTTCDEEEEEDKNRSKSRGVIYGWPLIGNNMNLLNNLIEIERKIII